MAGDKQHVTEGASIQETPAATPPICGAPITTCALQAGHAGPHSTDPLGLSPVPKGSVS